MGLHARLVLLGLIAAVALAAGTVCAGARRFEITEQRFSVRFENVGYRGGGQSVACAMTLVGSFHSRTISKVSGQLVGYITGGSIRQPCIEGSATLLNETMPWHIRYSSFSGTLPRITQIRINIVGWHYQETCIEQLCLYTSTAERPVSWFLEVTAEGRISAVRWDETMQVPVSPGQSLICPLELVLSGTGEVFAGTGTTTMINVRLVQ